MLVSMRFFPLGTIASSNSLSADLMGTIDTLSFGCSTVLDSRFITSKPPATSPLTDYAKQLGD